MPPTIWDGKRCSNGNRYPVTLVITVVVRNSAVQPSRLLPPSIPYTTKSPETIPIRLMAVCTMVKVAMLMPKIMMFLLGERELGDVTLRQEKIPQETGLGSGLTVC